MSVIYEALKKAGNNPAFAKPRKKVNYRKVVIFSLGIASCLIYTGFLYKMGRSYFTRNNAESYIINKQPLFEKKASPAGKYSPSGKTSLTRKGKNTFVLSGIIYSQDKPIAIINGKSLTAGKEIAGAKITSIEENLVTLDFRGKKVILTLE